MVTFGLAVVPIALLLALMVGQGWGADRAGPVVLVCALAIAFWAFGADAQLLALSQGKAAVLSVWILSIVWASLLLFNIVKESGGIAAIGRGLASFSASRPFQVLLLAWAFTSFLQGIAGYGVPVAVVAPLMVGLGFAPAASVVMTSIGHSWSVTFGSLAASFYVLIGASGIAGDALALETAALLGLACLLCGAGVLLALGGRSALRAGLPLLTVAGAVMALTQLVLASVGAYSLAAFGAGATGLVAMAALSRLPRYRRSTIAGGVDPSDEPHAPLHAGGQRGRMVHEFIRAFSAYGLLVAIVAVVNVVEPLRTALDAVRIELPFPETTTTLGWTNAATASYRTLSVLGDTGPLLLYAALGGYVLYRLMGVADTGSLGRAAAQTAHGALPTSIGIVTLVGMALAMTDSGMTVALAQGLVDLTGPLYPLAAPFVGVLGAFMTGSNTSSNILFTTLQRDAAVLLSLSPSLLLAAQTTGGALGSMMAPAKVALGCSTVGLGGNEGPVIRLGILYGLVITLVVGLATLVWAWLP